MNLGRLYADWHWHPVAGARPAATAAVATASLPAALHPLRDAARTDAENPDAWLRYVAALQVTLRVRQGDSAAAATLKQEQGVALATLSDLYSKQACRLASPAEAAYRSVRAAMILTSTMDDAAGTVQPQDLRISLLQCRVLNVWPNEYEIKRLYEEELAHRPEQHEEAQLLWLRSNMALWHTRALVAGAPPEIPLAQEHTLSVEHVRRVFHARDRHHTAALGLIQEAMDAWEGHKVLDVAADASKRMRHTLAALHEQMAATRRQVHLARVKHDTTTGYYTGNPANAEDDTIDWTQVHGLSSLPPPVTTPTAAEAAETEARHKRLLFALDADMVRHMDAWSATAAASVLIHSPSSASSSPVPQVPVRNGPLIIKRLLGISSNDPLPVRTQVAPALLAALTMEMQLVEKGWVGGVDWERTMKRLTAARTELLRFLGLSSEAALRQ